MEKLGVSHEQVKEYSLTVAENIKKTKEDFDLIIILTKWWLIPWYYIAKELW